MERVLAVDAVIDVAESMLAGVELGTAVSCGAFSLFFFLSFFSSFLWKGRGGSEVLGRWNGHS